MGFFRAARVPQCRGSHFSPSPFVVSPMRCLVRHGSARESGGAVIARKTEDAAWVSERMVSRQGPMSYFLNFSK